MYPDLIPTAPTCKNTSFLVGGLVCLSPQTQSAFAADEASLEAS